MGPALGVPTGPPSIPATFTDGTSNTILVAEAGTPVPGTKPEDIPYDPKKPIPELGGYFEGGFCAALADGAVHFYKKTIPESILRALITRAGGEAVDPTPYEAP